jgi:hypothetical protein
MKIKIKELNIESKKCKVQFFIDGKTDIVTIKVDGPNKEVEKEVGESMIGLMKTISEIQNKKIKVLQRRFTDEVSSNIKK